MLSAKWQAFFPGGGGGGGGVKEYEKFNVTGTGRVTQLP